MSSAEYALRLRQRPPWGDRTLAVLIGQHLAMTYKIHRSADSRPMTAEDFMPTGQPAPEAPSGPSGFSDIQDFMATI